MSEPQTTAPPTAACAHCGLTVTTRRAVRGPLFCCIGCRLAAAAGGQPGEAGARGWLQARLLVSAFLAMGVMTFSLVLYSTELHAAGDEPGLAALLDLGRAALALFSLPVLLLLGVPLLSGAWADLRAGRVRMDGLIVLATFAAFGLSLQHTWRRAGEVYYDTATMVLVLVTFGRRLEAHARVHASDAATALAECLPRAAHRRGPGGALADVSPDVLQAGDACELRPGEALPADAVVLAGRSEVACAHMTGEEAPRAAGPGDELPAGALNGTGTLQLRVLRPARASSLARLRELLDAPLPSTQLMRLTDRLAGWLAGLSILLAAGAGAFHAARHGGGEGLRVALSVLLVACPCALGLAVPLAYRGMRAALARRGVLVHDAAALERAARVDLVLLDKTGTLTDPADARASLLEARPGAGARLAALVTASGHALAPALQRAAENAGAAAAPDVRDAHLLPGRGAVGLLDGHPAAAGQPAWLDERGARWPDALAAARARWTARGGSLVALAQGDDVVALAGVEHGLRPGARAAVSALLRAGFEVAVLSGDRPQAAARVGAALGVPARGGLSPQDKRDAVREARAAGRVVLFAGDGVNDAPALREADVGLSVASGTAAARAQAGMELVGEDLRGLPLLLDGARTLRRAVRINLGWTLAYNTLLLALAAAGRLHPLLAAAAMILSSLMVSARSWRLLHAVPAAGEPAPSSPPRVDVPTERFAAEALA